MLHAGMRGSEVAWLSLTNNPCGLHSWGSAKVAGRVFFASLRIHAGVRVADRQRDVDHQKWRPVLRWVCITDNPCRHEPWMGGVVEGHCGDVACVSFADNPCRRRGRERGMAGIGGGGVCDMGFVSLIIGGRWRGGGKRGNEACVRFADIPQIARMAK
jgi:hypothetical protein